MSHCLPPPAWLSTGSMEKAQKLFLTFLDQWSTGCNAKIQFHCESGHLTVDLNADLGPWKAGCGLIRASPSRVRRRERRAAERDFAARRAAVNAPDVKARAEEVLIRKFAVNVATKAATKRAAENAATEAAAESAAAQASESAAAEEVEAVRAAEEAAAKAAAENVAAKAAAEKAAAKAAAEKAAAKAAAEEAVAKVAAEKAGAEKAAAKAAAESAATTAASKITISKVNEEKSPLRVLESDLAQATTSGKKQSAFLLDM